MIEFSARSHLKLTVTNRQLAILAGCLLGDGYIHPRGQIQIEHCSKQYPYLLWKYQELSSLAYGPPSSVKRFDTRYGKNYYTNRFWLRQFFRPWRKLFYPEGKKQISADIVKYLNDLSVAVWYMDDGNLYNNNVKIATDGFDEKSRKLLCHVLSNKFGVKSTIQASGKLRINSSSLKDFFRIVSPYIHFSMKYKVP